MTPSAAKPTSVVAQLVDVLTDPRVLELHSDEILALQSAICTLQTTLSRVFVAAKQREMNVAANPRQGEVLMDADAVSRFLDLPKPAIYGLMRSGELKFVQIGKYRKVSVNNLLAYLWKLHQETGADIPERMVEFVEYGKKQIRAEAVAKGGK